MINIFLQNELKFTHFKQQRIKFVFRYQEAEGDAVTKSVKKLMRRKRKAIDEESKAKKSRKRQ